MRNRQILSGILTIIRDKWEPNALENKLQSFFKDLIKRNTWKSVPGDPRRIASALQIKAYLAKYSVRPPTETTYRGFDEFFIYFFIYFFPCAPVVQKKLGTCSASKIKKNKKLDVDISCGERENEELCLC